MFCQARSPLYLYRVQGGVAVLEVSQWYNKALLAILSEHCRERVSPIGLCWWECPCMQLHCCVGCMCVWREWVSPSLSLNEDGQCICHSIHALDCQLYDSHAPYMYTVLYTRYSCLCLHLRDCHFKNHNMHGKRDEWRLLKCVLWKSTDNCKYWV